MGVPSMDPARRNDVTRPPPPTSPIFSSETAPTSGDRLLILSAHFPPGQAAGARRWEKFAHFAVARGFGLDVVTLDPRDVEANDSSRLESLPERVRVFGVRAKTHPISILVDALAALVRRLRALSSSARGTTTIGPAPVATPGEDWPRREEILSARWGPSILRRSLNALVEIGNDAAWADAAADCARNVFDAGVHRAIVSSGPPHMIHAAAARLARDAGIPLVVDLRDPWSRRERLQEGFASPLWFRLAEGCESRAFEQASLIVMNTPAAAQLMTRVHPGFADKIMSVTNGYDAEDASPAEFGDAFVIAYAGSIYLDRSPRQLFQATRRVVSDLGLAAGDLRIELMGYFDSDAIRTMARDAGVDDRLVLHPPGNLRDVSRLLARAPMLVNLPQDSDLAIPSKIFEYIVRPSWVLALAVPDSATGQVLAGTRADVVAPDDVNGIARVIRRRYEAYRAGERPQPIADDPRLGRAYQADILFDALERCLRRPGVHGIAARREAAPAAG